MNAAVLVGAAQQISVRICGIYGTSYGTMIWTTISRLRWNTWRKSQLSQRPAELKNNA